MGLFAFSFHIINYKKPLEEIHRKCYEKNMWICNVLDRSWYVYYAFYRKYLDCTADDRYPFNCWI